MTREKRDFYLVKRKDKLLDGRPVYYCRFRDADGALMPWRSTQTTAKIRAERWAKNQIAEGKIRPPSDLAGYLLTFWDYEQSQYVKSKRAEGRELSPVYVQNSQNLIRDYFLPYVKHRGVKTLGDLSKQILLEWRNHLYEHGCIDLRGVETKTAKISPATMNKVRQAVHVALEHAEALDLIPANPMRSIKRVKENPATRQIFERDELVKLFAKPWRDIRAYAGAMLAAATGLRLGEVRGLLCGNVHDGYLDVLTSWQDAEGLKPPKWNDIRYGVPLPSRVADALQAVEKVCPYSLDDDSFLFFGNEPGVPVVAYVLQHGLKEAMKAASIPVKGRSFHCLRHTAASLIAGDVGMDRVQRLLGHTTGRMSEAYVHATDADRDVIAKAQANIWGQ